MSDLLDLDALIAAAAAAPGKAKAKPAPAAVWRETRTYAIPIPVELALVRRMGTCAQCGTTHPQELELWIRSVAPHVETRFRITKPSEYTPEVAALPRITRDEESEIPFCPNCATALFYKDLPDDLTYPAA